MNHLQMSFAKGFPRTSWEEIPIGGVEKHGHMETIIAPKGDTQYKPGRQRRSTKPNADKAAEMKQPDAGRVHDSVPSCQ